jgi:gamma-glutamyl hercynylcysteine S-oxide synthase
MPPTAAPPLELDRVAILDRFARVRRRSRELFAIVSDEAYYARPIALRNPIVFYEGHLVAFAVNALLKKGLGQPGIDESLEVLFARGIDPEQTPDPAAESAWPARDRVLAYVGAAEGRLREALATAPLQEPGHPLLDRAEAVFAILEHEEMHQETLQYIWHRLPFEQKRPPAATSLTTGAAVPPRAVADVPGGVVTLGARRDAVAFGWDNEFPEWQVEVAPFSVDRHDVSNADFLAFVEDDGYAREEFWDHDGWAWRVREVWSTRSSGSGTMGAGTGARCSNSCRCPPRGRCT